jgi:hypothetical protein
MKIFQHDIYCSLIATQFNKMSISLIFIAPITGADADPLANPLGHFTANWPEMSKAFCALSSMWRRIAITALLQSIGSFENHDTSRNL